MTRDIFMFPRIAANLMASKRIRLAVFGTTLALTAMPAHADLVIEAPTLTAAPGSSGSFDILITDTDPAGSPAYSVGADTVELGISGSGIEFTNATILTTSEPYIYSDSLDGYYGVPLDGTGVPFPKNDLTAADADNVIDGAININPGDTYGLANVSYSVDPSATPGTQTLTIEDLGGGTSLSDGLGNAIAFDATNGSITIAVPEPTSIGLLAGASLLLMRRRQTNRSHKNPEFASF